MWNRLRRLSPLTWMVALLLLATLLRFAAWQSAPPGLRYDETTIVFEVDQIRAGDRPIYMESSAQEALYHYLFAAAARHYRAASLRAALAFDRFRLDRRGRHLHSGAADV